MGVCEEVREWIIGLREDGVEDGERERRDDMCCFERLICICEVDLRYDVLVFGTVRGANRQTSKIEFSSSFSSLIVRTAVSLRSVTLRNPRSALTSACTSVSIPPRNDSTAAAAIRASHTGSVPAPVSHSSSSPVVAERPNHATGPSSPHTTEPFPRRSDAGSVGNAARTLRQRESAAYIPCTSALPSVRAKVAPKRRVKNASTDSSSSS